MNIFSSTGATTNVKAKKKFVMKGISTKIFLEYEEVYKIGFKKN